MARKLRESVQDPLSMLLILEYFGCMIPNTSHVTLNSYLCCLHSFVSFIFVSLILLLDTQENIHLAKCVNK